MESLSRVVGRVVLAGAGDDRHMGELRRLSETLGLEVCGETEQARRDPSGYLGAGKRAELGGMVSELGAGFVVADDELTASEARVLERDAGVAVVDRTELIIRIFEANARDRPSKLQVELAEMEYLLPRVRGMWRHLERLGGGLGSGGGAAVRGPGEQQLEYDRREIRARMEKLRARLASEGAARGVRRARLRSAGIPKVALVGYTNAGKTTILNRLAFAGRSTRDSLFETLETTTRRVEGYSPPPQGGGANGSPGASGGSGSFTPDFTLTDTVGFIRKLPTQLVESFASTLEAAADADVLVLCADASSSTLDDEVETVKDTLSESGPLDGRPLVLALNKSDLLTSGERASLMSRNEGAVLISAVAEGREAGGSGLLLDRIHAEISATRERMEVLIPHSSYEDAARLYGAAEIHSSEDRLDGVLMDVSLPRSLAASYAPYRTSP